MTSIYYSFIARANSHSLSRSLVVFAVKISCCTSTTKPFSGFKQCSKQNWATKIVSEKKFAEQNMRNEKRQDYAFEFHTFTHSIEWNRTRTSPLTNCIPFYRYACIKSQTAIDVAAIFPQAASTTVVLTRIQCGATPIKCFPISLFVFDQWFYIVNFLTAIYFVFVRISRTYFPFPL